MEVCEETGVVAVGETPEKKPNKNNNQSHGSRLTDEKMTSQSVVANAMTSCVNNTHSRNSQRKETDSKATGGGGANARTQISTPKTNGGTKTYPYKQPPHKSKVSAQASPQKQSTLTNFFQSVNKKRPLEDSLSAVLSEPKRPAQEASLTVQASNTETIPREVSSLSFCRPQTVSQTPDESPGDLFGGQSVTSSKEPQSRKRKEMEEEIQIEELESIMSEDMCDFDDKLSSNQSRQERQTIHISDKQDSSSSNKRQRLHQDEEMTRKERSKLDPKKESDFRQNHSTQSGPPVVSVKMEQLNPTNDSSKPAEMPTSSTSRNMKTAEDDTSFIEDAELLDVDLYQDKDETKTRVEVKQEVQESNIDESLPKKLLVVEFRSLTVSAAYKSKAKQVQENRHIKNFKRFLKRPVPGVQGFPPIIGGSDLLIHNRGKNSDMDEWLKNAAEEERQNRRDESVGDDLFRYNPTKLTKRR